MNKKIFCFITILLLLFSQISFIFANSTFVECPVIESTQSTESAYINIVSTYGSVIGYTSDNKAIKACAISYFTGAPESIYAFVWSNWSYSFISPYDSNFTRYSNFRVCVWIDGSSNLTYNSTWNPNSSSTIISNGYIGNAVAYGGPTINSGTPLCSSFSDFDSACVALDTFINPPVINYSYPENIEVGNIVYYELGTNYIFDITLKSYFNEKSGFFSNTWTSDNRRFGFSDSLPDTSVSIGSSSGSGILWTETTPKDVSGRSHYGTANITGTTTGRYLWIINPLYNENYYNDSLSANSLNGLLTVMDGIPSGTNVYTYSVAQNNSVIGLESTFLSSVGGTGTTSTSSAVAWTNSSTGAIYSPPIGGDNSPPAEVSASEGIRQTLEQLTQSITDIFTTPITYIHNLLSIGSDFLHNISGVWSWLPEPFPAIVITGLTIVLAIGILHTLL